MVTALRKLRETFETYHGFPVLDIRVGDEIPTPRVPERFVVQVTPDLARYWLTLNHPLNRNIRESKVRQYAADMAAGLWKLTPQTIVFSITGMLEDGQNRLMAVTHFGQPVYMLVDFGWEEGIINHLDSGAAKTNADAAKAKGFANYNVASTLVTQYALYEETAGTALSWIGRPRLSRPRSAAAIESDESLVNLACNYGQRVSRAYTSLSPNHWALGYYAISKANESEVVASEFFDELLEGGAPGSATRALEKYVTRRRVGDSKTGDQREHLENIIRAFNAWHAGKQFHPVTKPSFTLSRPKVR